MNFVDWRSRKKYSLDIHDCCLSKWKGRREHELSGPRSTPLYIAQSQSPPEIAIGIIQLEHDTVL